jgi:hypothetical protein
MNVVHELVQSGYARSTRICTPFSLDRVTKNDDQDDLSLV